MLVDTLYKIVYSYPIMQSVSPLHKSTRKAQAQAHAQAHTVKCSKTFDDWIWNKSVTRVSFE